MTLSSLLAAEPQSRVLQPDSVALQTAVHLAPIGTPTKEHIRHILLGSPGAVQQTIHLLHTLRYAETILWTPVLHIADPLTIAPTPGEAISLLRKPI